MSKSEIMPATQQQNLEARIGNSTKIAKRLMKKTLEDKRAEAMDKYKALKNATDVKSFALRNEVETYIKEKVVLSVINDSEMTRLRNLMEKFSVYEFRNEDNLNEPHHPKTNKDMLEGTIDFMDLLTLVSRIAEGGVSKDSLGGYILSLWENEQAIEVTAYLVYPDISMVESERYSTELMCFDIDVPIPDDMVRKAEEIWAHGKDLSALNEEVNAIDTQLKNIDDTVEEMEARLLVKELQSSEEGMATLEIAGDLVGSMLGETPALLANIDKK